MSEHSWETRSETPSGSEDPESEDPGCSWETHSGSEDPGSEDSGNEDADDWEDDSHGSDPGPAADNEQAPDRSYGQQLVDYCQVLLLTRTLNAKHFCIIMWLAALAGIAAAKPYGMKPDAQTGKYLRLLKKKLGYLSDKSALYELSTPGRRKDTLSRTINTMHVPPLLLSICIHVEAFCIYTHTHQQYRHIYINK